MKNLTLEQRKQVAARLNFYRELGIYDFYQQPQQSGTAGAEALKPARILTARVTPCPDTLPASPEAIASSAHSGNSRDPVTELKIIREDLGDCTRCGLHKGRTNLVFGVGNPRAELMFIGEGPGADEDAQGLPFVGRAGQLLNNMIAAMGLKREDVYIANTVKCRPPGNRTPERDECEECMPFLMRQIAAIRPKAIAALGATAAKNLLGINDTMGAMRSRTYDFTPSGYAGEPIKLFPTFHPAYLLRDPRQKKEAWADLQKVMRFLGLKPPPKTDTSPEA